MNSLKSEVNKVQAMHVGWSWEQAWNYLKQKRPELFRESLPKNVVPFKQSEPGKKSALVHASSEKTVVCTGGFSTRIELE